jgi:hypothetical protein
MNRLIKLILNLFLAALAVALTLVVVFLLTPVWQKAVLEETLGKDPARRWQVGEVLIRPAHVEVEGLYILEGNMGAEIRVVEMSGPFWKAPFTRLLEIESGRVTGIEADLSAVRVGDLTSEDYQSFLGRVTDDRDFWKERIGLVLSKFAASGLDVQLRDVELSGRIVMPGGHVIPVRWRILEADSAAPRMIRIEPLSNPLPMQL